MTVVSATGLLLTLNRCEQNPIITDLPGSQWEISEISYPVVDTVLVRTPGNGASLTLYVGYTQDQAREARALLKFAELDSSEKADLVSARLVLFRRTFNGDQLDNSSLFTLHTIDDPDSIWSEYDTGLTLDHFPNTTSVSTAFMDTSPTPAFDEGDTLVYTDREHLRFQLDRQVFQEWSMDEKAGFLITLPVEMDLFGFHARGDVWPPYLELVLSDTTVYRRSTADLTICTWPNPNFDPTDYDSLLHLDHSSGIRSHIDFPNPDTTSIITGARLTLYLNDEVEVSPIVADHVDIQVLRRALPLVQGDSTELLISRVVYQGTSDSLVLELRGFLSGVATGVFMNYGLDLVVIPNNHDFDRLVFWGSNAPDPLRPRLDVIYSFPYGEVQ
ncbi:MAG: hypothetical protein JSU77_08545 [Fidelibacterota bacterium]|nr:MAG: hypothetical protein JSU77_08545 [Candidatus Neomarinimicrobiota bacterium]